MTGKRFKTNFLDDDGNPVFVEPISESSKFSWLEDELQPYKFLSFECIDSNHILCSLDVIENVKVNDLLSIQDIPNGKSEVLFVEQVSRLTITDKETGTDFGSCTLINVKRGFANTNGNLYWPTGSKITLIGNAYFELNPQEATQTSEPK